MKKYFNYLLFILLVSCYKETEVPVQIEFEAKYVQENKTIPVQIRFDNKTEGAESYEWIFEGGIPTTSNKKDPGTITYNQPGEYTVTLKASNNDGSSQVKEMKIQIYDAINIDFETQIVNNQANYPPVEVQIINRTNGKGLNYHWTFEGGNPETSNEQIPSNVVFNTPGEHLITLTVNNGTKTEAKSQKILVAPDIEADFSWEVEIFDNDYQAPVKLYLKNTSKSATSYTWNFEGADISGSTQTEPVILYNTPGIFTIKLTADNGSNKKTIEKKITIHPDTNLRIFKAIKLGINSAHNSGAVGAYFSAARQRVYTSQELTPSISKDIDIIFFGLNSNFTYNKFISPDKALNEGFPEIPLAVHTKIINSQEICNCGINFTPEIFDAMINDNPLKSLNISETPSGLQAFKNILPRIVLFQTQDGRKGAIKIEQMVSNGMDSYIVCDIKVQKVK